MNRNNNEENNNNNNNNNHSGYENCPLGCGSAVECCYNYDAGYCCGECMNNQNNQ
jgi:hypothetical protein